MGVIGENRVDSSVREALDDIAADAAAAAGYDCDLPRHSFAPIGYAGSSLASGVQIRLRDARLRYLSV
jgi:hypothetical protein